MIEQLPGKHLRHWVRRHIKYGRRPRRYRRLLELAARLRPASLVEIGVFTGQRGVEMIEAASLGQGAGHIAYHGFDLFGHMTDGILADELSKQPDDKQQVQERLAATGATITLHEGWSQETIPALHASSPDFRADLIFIDGGHAVETIQADWLNVQPLLTQDATIMLDDYYVDCPHLTDRFGCNTLVENLDPTEWAIHRHPEVDRFVHDGRAHNVALVELSRR